MDNFNLPQEKLHTLKDELRHLLNRLSIDNELGTPDFILAEMITEQINSMVVAKRKTLELAGESLKTIQLEFQGIDGRGEKICKFDTENIANNPPKEEREKHLKK